MEQERVPVLHFCDDDVMLFTDGKLLFIRKAFGAVVQKTCQPGFLDGGFIPHGQGCSGIFHTQGVLKAFLFLDFFHGFS